MAEQERPETDLPIEAPEADVQEQHDEIAPPLGAPSRITDDPEVPEADAIEQATPEPVDDEGYER